MAVTLYPLTSLVIVLYNYLLTEDGVFYFVLLISYFMSPLLMAGIPSLFNVGAQILTNKSNQNFYSDMQAKANQFAKDERLAAQEYNSLKNQYEQMQSVGLNPNLISGQSFVPTSAVGNQSVSTPQGIAPQMPSETLSQSMLNKSSASNQEKQGQKALSEKQTIDALRDGQLRQQDATYYYTLKQTDFTDAEINNAQRQFELLGHQMESVKQSIIESDARTQNLRENTSVFRQQREFDKQKFPLIKKQLIAQIYKLATSSQVDIAQKNFLYANAAQLAEMTLALRYNNYVTENTLEDKIELSHYSLGKSKIQVSILGTQDKMFQWNLGQNLKYGEWERRMKVASDALGVVDKLLQLSPYQRALDNAKGLIPFTSGASRSNNNPAAVPYSQTFDASFDYVEW